MAFADDLTHFTTGSNIENMKIDLQEACSTLIKWCDSRMLSLSLEKTEMNLFSNKHAMPENFTININCHTIKHKDNIRCLGILLNRKLNWSDHISQKGSQS